MLHYPTCVQLASRLNGIPQMNRSSVEPSSVFPAKNHEVPSRSPAIQMLRLYERHVDPDSEDLEGRSWLSL